MGIPVGELLERCSSRDLAYYLAEESIAPHGDDRIEVMFALLTYVVSTALGSKEPFESFMPFSSGEQSIEQQMAIVGQAIGKTQGAGGISREPR